MTASYDLFGDPVPEGFGKRGRPPHLVTQATKAKVVLMLAIGRKSGDIAAALGISEPTLRKNYGRELRTKEEARFKVEAVGLLRLYEQVEAGNMTAIKELRKVLDKAADNDGEFYKRAAAQGRTIKPPKLGKKEQAHKEALEPNADSPLGKLMNLRANNPDRMN